MSNKQLQDPKIIFLNSEFLLLGKNDFSNCQKLYTSIKNVQGILGNKSHDMGSYLALTTTLQPSPKAYKFLRLGKHAICFVKFIFLYD
jgi:hypothetical protein